MDLQTAPDEEQVAEVQVIFSFGDPRHRLSGVRLWQEIGIAGDLLDFTLEDGVWSLALPTPSVDRMEYLFELRHRDGSTETVLDPASPRSCPGAFGARSVLELPGYDAPGWLADPAPAGTFVTAATSVGADPAAHVSWQVWSPEGLGPDDQAPLIVVHDGPEYDALADITRCLAAEVAAGRLPPVRAVLLEPGDRDERYSANPAYARTLALAVLSGVRRTFPTAGVVGLGASLGALAMLHASRRHPASVDALLLQSGSFFDAALDAQERRFARFPRIERFVRGVLDGTDAAARPLPVVLTCGTAEENLASNRQMAQALTEQGYRTRLDERRDAHNYTAWRDSLLPGLRDLVLAVV